ncbi:MAG TPA: hypothetical protein VFZ77_02305, partial [Acidimicrobiales bacterium]
MTGSGDRFSDMEPAMPPGALDAAVDRLLRGQRVEGDLADLAAFVADVTAAASGPPPPRSAAVDAALRALRSPNGTGAQPPAAVGPPPVMPHPGRTGAEGRAGAGVVVAGASPAPRHDRVRLDPRAPRRSTVRRVATLGLAGKAVAALAVAGAAATGAAAAGVLPDPVSGAVRRAVELVTPFELAQEAGPARDAVASNRDGIREGTGGRAPEAARDAPRGSPAARADGPHAGADTGAAKLLPGEPAPTAGSGVGEATGDPSGATRPEHPALPGAEGPDDREVPPGHGGESPGRGTPPLAAPGDDAGPAPAPKGDPARDEAPAGPAPADPAPEPGGPARPVPPMATPPPELPPAEPPVVWPPGSGG